MHLHPHLHPHLSEQLVRDRRAALRRSIGASRPWRPLRESDPLSVLDHASTRSFVTVVRDPRHVHRHR